MAKEATDAYQSILKAARNLSPADQLRLAKELVSGDHLVAFWEDWKGRLAKQNDIVSDAEIDATIAQVRAERRRGNR